MKISTLLAFTNFEGVLRKNVSRCICVKSFSFEGLFQKSAHQCLTSQISRFVGQLETWFRQAICYVADLLARTCI
jgi:hypothetical protein